MFIFSFKPDTDGVTHINIYSDGKTQLGRFLSHFAPAKVSHPVYGEFPTMENFWHYVKHGAKVPEFRTLSPYIVKNRSKQYTVHAPNDFDDMIRAMNKQKIESRPKALKAFIECDLPFDHYYMIHSKSTGELIKVRPREADKLVIMFESLRMELRKQYECTDTGIPHLRDRPAG